MTTMKVNPLRDIWNAGRSAVGTYILARRDISTVETAAAAGLDYVIFDLEHRPYGPESIHDLCQVSRLSGMAALVTVAQIEHHSICHALDLGASGVILPQVQTIEQVELAINAVHYPPKGRRGRCGVAGHNLYRAAPTADEVEHYNRDVALLLKVETEYAIEHLDQLVAFDRVDGVQVGPGDLALDLGVPNNHAQIANLTDQVRKVCKKRGIQFGDHADRPEQVPDMVAEGSTWTTVGIDITILRDAWSKAAQANQQAQSPSARST